MNVKREYVLELGLQLVRTMALGTIVGVGFVVMCSAAFLSGVDSARGRMSKWSSKDSKLPFQTAAVRSKALPKLDDLG
jgi:hypothetical protein